MKSSNPFHCGDEDGYTLLEMLVVIAILGMIIAFATPQVLGHLERSKTKAALIQISSLAAALDLYRLDVGSYPSEQQGLAALLSPPPDVKNWQGPYLTRNDGIIDPWERPYIYRLQVAGRPFLVQSLGRDGKLGGTGPDEDVSNLH
jgi:general secretion pathway protein G